MELKFKSRRRYLGLAAVVTTGLVAGMAACSSSGDSTSSTSASATTGTAAGTSATGSPLTIEQIWDLAPAAGNTTVSINLGAKAAVTYINNHGGIGGHPINLISCTEALSANDAINCADKAVSNPSVVALVGNDNSESQSSDPILLKAGIANIGQYSLSGDDWRDPNSFPIGIGNLEQAGAAAMLVDLSRARHVHALELEQVPSAAAALAVSDLALTQRGVAAAAPTLVAPTATDISAQALQLFHGADGILAITQASLIQAVARQRTSLGFSNVPIGIPAGACQPCSAFGSSNGGSTSKIYVASSFEPPTYTQGAGVAAMVAQLKAIGDSAVPDELNEYGWAAVQEFKAAAAVALRHGGKVTRASILAALNHMTSFQIPGMTPVINFTKTSSLAGAQYPRLFNDAAIYCLLLPDASSYKAINGTFHQVFLK